MKSAIILRAGLLRTRFPVTKRYNTLLPFKNENSALFPQFSPQSCLNYAVGNRRFLQISSINLVKKSAKMTDQDWEKKLTPEQYYVCRERGTEPAFSGKFCNHFEKGIYSCVCCGSDLFSSETKFQSGCGWPSFHTAHGAVNGDESKSNIIRRPDHSRGIIRTEVICKNCDAHLGHVFNDGPEPTGERFCINSLTLTFTPKK